MTRRRIAKPYPYLHRDIDRQGVTRWRLRAPGHNTVTIKGVFGSPEFAANYKAALEGETPKPLVTTPHGTMAALARSYLNSAAFAGLSKATQRARRHLIESYMIEKWGTLSAAGLQRHHVKTIIDQLAATPGTARNVLSAIRVLMAVAIDQGIRTDNPAADIKRPKLSNSVAYVDRRRNCPIRIQASGW